MGADATAASRGRDLPARPLREVLKEYLDASGLARRMKQGPLIAAWEEVVGRDVAAQTRIVNLRRQALQVEVASAALLQELAGFRKRELLAALTQTPAGGGVTDIRFQLGSFSQTAES